MIDKYIGYIADVRRYSQRTQQIYRDVLEQFASYAQTTDFSEVTPTLVRAYELHILDEKKLGPRTVNLHLSVLSGFFRYLMHEGVIESNPCRTVSRPKTAKRLADFYRQDAMEEYFASTQTYVTEPDLGMAERYRKRLARLIISLLYDTGMRRSELIALRRGDIDFKRRVVRVHGKGDKMREIPLIPSLCEEISLYLQSVDSMVGCGSDLQSPLLVTLKGQGLYPVYIDRTVKEELGSISSITGRKSPHVLRHSLATGLLNDGTDLNSIKELLGHSSLAATQVYTHNSIEKLKTVYDNAHPRAKSGGNHGDKNQIP
ncbi:MAG: tyrosine-type recombinase/integrase [Bacteroidales bacterium]|nr:tyrosine-type recombinase/integrase [Bacteroidales bacterium]